MSRSEKVQGLKTGLVILVGLAAIATGVHRLVEYSTPIGSASGYHDFKMNAESTNTFSSAFGVLCEELEAAGFSVAPYGVSTNDLRFEYELESAGALERLQCVSIQRESLDGFLLHWSEAITSAPGIADPPMRSANFKHDLFGVQGEGIHFKDLEAFELILEGVLVRHRSKMN